MDRKPNITLREGVSQLFEPQSYLVFLQHSKNEALLLDREQQTTQHIAVKRANISWSGVRTGDGAEHTAPELPHGNALIVRACGAPLPERRQRLLMTRIQRAALGDGAEDGLEV